METIKITNENFEKEVLESSKPVLVDFWASWCGPCRMQAPVLDELAVEYDSIKIGKLNIDEEQKLAFTYKVSSIPTLILFKDGKLTDKKVGYLPQNELVKWIKTYE